MQIMSRLAVCGLWSLAWASTAGAWSTSFGFGSGTAVAVAANGDIVAAGWEGESFSPLLNIIKVSASGKERWRRATPAPWIGATVTFTSDGDVVAGVGGGTSNVFRLSGGTGATLWQAHVDGGATAAAVDAADDVLVAGGTAITKLDGGDGSELWRYLLPGTAVTVDGAGAVLVVGSVDSDIVVAKLAGGDGSELWRSVYPVPLLGGHVLTTLALAPDGDVFVAHDSSGTTTPLTLVRFAGSTGAELWRHERDIGFHYADHVTVAIGPDGDVVAETGHPYGSVALKVATLDGSEIWHVTAPFEQFVLDDGGDLLGIDNIEIGNVGYPNARVSKLSGATGATLVSEQTSSFDFFEPSAIALHPGGLVATGDTDPSSAFGPPQGFTTVGMGDRLSGTKLMLLAPATPANRRLSLVSKDLWLTVPAGSPLIGGVTLELANPLSTETVSIPLPAENWTVRSSKDGDIYRYVDRALAAGPCKSVALRPHRYFKARCGGAQLGFTLDEPSQQRMRVRLIFPGSETFARCFEFGGEVVRDAPGRFLAKNAPPPAACAGGL